MTTMTVYTERGVESRDVDHIEVENYRHQLRATRVPVTRDHERAVYDITGRCHVYEVPRHARGIEFDFPRSFGVTQLEFLR